MSSVALGGPTWLLMKEIAIPERTLEGFLANLSARIGTAGSRDTSHLSVS